MRATIQFRKVWSDDDLIELQIVVNDGKSSFVNTIYTWPAEMADTLHNLNQFSKNIKESALSIDFGKAGPDIANGVFQAKMKCRPAGRIDIFTFQQSDHFEFSSEKVASEARLFLTSEPALLDNFVAEFKLLCSKTTDQAILECIDF